MAVDRFPVEEGSILLFARSIGDPNPIYADRDHAATTEVGGIIAPPTYVQSSAQFDPDYPLRPKPGERWFGSGKHSTGRVEADGPTGDVEADGPTGDVEADRPTGDVEADRPTGDVEAGEPTGGGGTGLHAEQHYDYHRPLRAGDVLSATTRPGEHWEKQGRSGKLVFSESITEYRDADGELVVTARGVGVKTERPVAQEG